MWNRSSLPFGGGDADGGEPFDAYDEFVPEHIPEPGELLADHDVLTGREHAAFHRLSRELFEERGVYDATFGYNLARLNLDRRHPDAGFRYARDADDPAVLWAVFAPTTEFCPQAQSLSAGAARAWNAAADRHEYDRVRVRVAPSFRDSEAANEHLEGLEAELFGEGAIEDADLAADVEDENDDPDDSGEPAEAPF